MENKMLDVMKEAALAGAAGIKIAKAINITQKEKSPGEFVTNCDIASETAIISTLKKYYPHSSFLSEEIGKLEGGNPLWVIDPIDGTHNFMFGDKLYGISIAAHEHKKAMAGVIYLPEFDAMYYAARGGGAFLNGKKINVSNRATLDKCMIAYGPNLHGHKDAMSHLSALASKCFTIRISGSAVVGLANIASGIIDARVLHNTKPVDFAAGALIVTEAGGKATDFNGKKYTLETPDLIISNGKIHKELCALLRGNGK